MKEFAFIDWIRRQAKFDRALVQVGPGDDCAVLKLGHERLLVTTDQVLDGAHFLLHEHGPAAGGRKAVARNLSDIAAMAGQPLAMVASVALPAGFSQQDAQELYRGMRQIGDEFNCPLVGGDVAAWRTAAQRLQISVTVLGTAGGVEPVLRSGARPGDIICVSGSLGGAWRSRRHLEFVPRVREARVLARYGLSAMIDISDGLAADLGHIAADSGVGAVLEAAAIPVHPLVTQAGVAAEIAGAGVAHDLPAALRAALFDGEDYELLFTLPQERADRLVSEQPLAAAGLAVPITRIGQIIAGYGLWLMRDGRKEPLPAAGWQHES